MARDFDGTNDNLSSSNNAISGIDTQLLSCAFWTIFDTQPSANNYLVALNAQNTSGQGRTSFVALAPGTAGFRLRFGVDWSTTDGQWRTDDLSLNTRLHLVVTYDRGLTTNDPVIYVDGASASITEIANPAGSVTGGEDTLRLGEDAAGAQDLNGIIQHLVVDGGATWSAADVNRARWWGRPFGGCEVYHPLVTSKLADEGTAAETLTANGTTVVSFPTPVVRPGSALMGMGVGW